MGINGNKIGDKQANISVINTKIPEISKILELTTH